MKELLVTAVFAISMTLAIAFCYSKCMQLNALEERVSLLEQKIERKFLPVIKISGKTTIYNGGGEVIVVEDERK